MIRKEIKHKTVKQFADKHGFTIVPIRYDKMYIGYDLYKDDKKVMEIKPMFNHKGANWSIKMDCEKSLIPYYYYSFSLKNVLNQSIK